MKSLAEDSKTLAVLALKENLSMRFLQIITMLFLPATFIAVRGSYQFTASAALGLLTNISRAYLARLFLIFVPRKEYLLFQIGYGSTLGSR